MTSSDHRHPGAKKRPANNLRDCRRFPLIVGPPFIHATNPAKVSGIIDNSIVAQEA